MCASEFLKDHPDLVKRVLAVYEEARKYSLANYDELKKAFIGGDQAAGRGGRQAAQGAHRADPQQDRRAAARLDPAAGIALQKAGVIKADVDVKAALDDLIDDQVPLPTN